MNLSITRKLKFAGAALSFAALTFGSAVNAGTIFFGEDLNPSSTVPVGGAAELARADFLSNLVGVGTEDFEGFVDGLTADGIILSFPGSSGGISATLTDPSNSAEIAGSPGAGRFATSGVNFLQEVTNSFSLSFSTEIAAFGFYGTDIGDFDGQITLAMTGGAAQNFVVPNTVNAPNGSLLFWGFIGGAGETFSSVAFGNTNTGTDFFGFDDLTIGELGQVVPPNGVPVPGTIALFALGLGLVGGAVRRKRS